MRSIVAVITVVFLGGWTLWTATDGARAFTSEGARRLSIEQNPRPMPNVVLQDQSGEYFNINDLRGRIVVADFIYTRCLTFCTVLGNTLQALQRSLPRDALGNDVVLLSISFDPDYDIPSRLSAYGERFHADTNAWRIARVANAKDLPKLLEAFGITVIPDGEGGFEHNAAVHIVDDVGRLARIVDYDDPQAAAVAVQSYL